MIVYRINLIWMYDEFPNYVMNNIPTYMDAYYPGECIPQKITVAWGICL